MFVDPFDRTITYLRISRANQLSVEEIVRVVETAAQASHVRFIQVMLIGNTQE